MCLGQGLALVSSPEHDGCCQSDGGEEDLWAPVVSRCNASPVLQAREHDFDPVASFVVALVVLDGFATRLPSADAGLYTIYFQCISEPVSVMASVSQQPVRFLQVAQQGRCTGIVTDQTGSHEEPDRPVIGIGNGMQLRVRAVLCATDQTAPLVACSPFSTAGWSPYGAPSDRSRRSSPSSERLTRQPCIDPVKICSCYKGEGSDECDDGRQHQTVDCQAKDGAGGRDHLGQDDGGRGQSSP